MSLLIYALIALIIAGLAAAIVRRVLPVYADIGSIIILLVAVIVIAQRSGIGL